MRDDERVLRHGASDADQRMRGLIVRRGISRLIPCQGVPLNRTNHWRGSRVPARDDQCGFGQPIARKERLIPKAARRERFRKSAHRVEANRLCAIERDLPRRQL